MEEGGHTGRLAHRRWGLAAVVLLIAGVAVAVAALGDDTSPPESGVAVRPTTPERGGSSGSTGSSGSQKEAKRAASEAREGRVEDAAAAEPLQKAEGSDPAQGAKCFKQLSPRKCERLIEEIRKAPKSFESAERLLESISALGAAGLKPGDEPGAGNEAFEQDPR